MPKNNPPNQSLDSKIEEILARWPAGMTAIMISNCYLNMEQEDFEEFMLGYSKGQHKFEGTQNQCDCCNGIEIGRDDIKSLITSEIVKELEKLKKDMSMHTVPEGRDLITRGYLNNSIAFRIAELQNDESR